MAIWQYDWQCVIARIEACVRQYLPDIIDTFIAQAHIEIENPRNYIKIQVFRQNVNPQKKKKKNKKVYRTILVEINIARLDNKTGRVLYSNVSWYYSWASGLIDRFGLWCAIKMSDTWRSAVNIVVDTRRCRCRCQHSAIYQFIASTLDNVDFMSSMSIVNT